MNERRLRILYVGDLSAGATCRHRFTVLSELGHDVVPLDLNPYAIASSRILNGLQFRLSAGPGVWRFNRDFLRQAVETRPDVIWIDKGLYLWRQTIRRAREIGGKTPVVHYNPDDPFGGYRQGWRVFLQAIPEYDLHFVPRAVNVAEYERCGARRVVRYWFSFDRSAHCPVEISAADRARLGGPVGFVGQREPERMQSMGFLAERGIPVRVWGPAWDRSMSTPNLRIEGTGLFGPDYSKVVCAFDINLGFLRKRNRDLHTTRTFEIPACGAFLLAERTTEHQELFEEGREAVFFDSDAELFEKTKYYLENPEERQRIARAGYERCLRSGYSNHDRLAQMIRTIEDQLL